MTEVYLLPIIGQRRTALREGPLEEVKQNRRAEEAEISVRDLYRSNGKLQRFSARQATSAQDLEDLCRSGGSGKHSILGSSLGCVCSTRMSLFGDEML